MIDNLLKFVALTHKFNQIKRKIYATGEDRWESDSEHAFQLAMCAWYLIEKDNLHLDKDLVIKYALVHDLVEIYAGDTFAFDKDQVKLDSQKAREALAAKKLEEEIPEFSDVHKLIQQYENLVDEESKFVYALDKLLPAMNNYLDSGKTWKELGMNLAEVQREKKRKIEPNSEVVYKYWQELDRILSREEDKFFG